MLGSLDSHKIHVIPVIPMKMLDSLFLNDYYEFTRESTRILKSQEILGCPWKS